MPPKKNTKPRPCDMMKPILMGQVVNSITKEQHMNMSKEEIKRLILERTCLKCLKPFTSSVQKECHLKYNSCQEVDRSKLKDNWPSKFLKGKAGKSENLEEILSDAQICDDDSESDLSSAEKEMKKKLKDSESELDSLTEDDSYFQECSSCKVEINGEETFCEDKDETCQDEEEALGLDLEALGLEEDCQCLYLDNWSIFCESWHLGKTENLLDLIQKGKEVYFSGSVDFFGKEKKLCKAGPITGWYIQIEADQENFTLCISGTHHYTLKEPSPQYKPFFQEMQEKIKFLTITRQYFNKIINRKDVGDEIDFYQIELQEKLNISDVSVFLRLSSTKKLIRDHFLTLVNEEITRTQLYQDLVDLVTVTHGQKRKHQRAKKTKKEAPKKEAPDSDIEVLDEEKDEESAQEQLRIFKKHVKNVLLPQGDDFDLLDSDKDEENVDINVKNDDEEQSEGADKMNETINIEDSDQEDEQYEADTEDQKMDIEEHHDYETITLSSSDEEHNDDKNPKDKPNSNDNESEVESCHDTSDSDSI